MTSTISPPSRLSPPSYARRRRIDLDEDSWDYLVHRVEHHAGDNEAVHAIIYRAALGLVSKYQDYTTDERIQVCLTLSVSEAIAAKNGLAVAVVLYWYAYSILTKWMYETYEYEASLPIGDDADGPHAVATPTARW